MIGFTAERYLHVDRRPISIPIIPCAGILISTFFSCAFAQEIPSGFKVERYTQLWEHNPFTEAIAAAPQVRSSVFDNLFLTSWLIDAGKVVICVQNSESNEVQTVTAESNQNNLRLLGMRLNANPELVEAIISDGKEQGTVKFRVSDKNVGGAPATVAAQSVNTNAPFGRQSNSAGTAPRNSRSAVNPLNPLTPGSPGNAPAINQRPPHRGTPVYRPGVG